MKLLFSMLRFMTRLPVPGGHELTRHDLAGGMMVMPFIGAVVGGIAALAYFGASLFLDHALASFAALSALVLVTGGLHLDGLADTFDGVMSHRGRTRILEIMKDSRLGASGAIALIFILGGKYLCILSLAGGPAILPALVTAPVLGRTSMVISAGMGAYARSGEGLGSFVDETGLREIAVAVIIAAAVTFPLMGLWGLITLAAVSVFAVVFTAWLKVKIGGITGDTLGACIEIAETIALFTLAAPGNLQ